ncbi:hypothetical protein O0L34_g11054 [Tuta absoluta]|nr:hypothetical protein O0L34_g11054 [Tuta absoluta]
MAHYVVAAIVDADERNQQERLRLRSLRDTSNPFNLPNRKFRKLFRIPVVSAQYLCEVLENYPRFKESDNIPIHIKILGALHFFVSGSYQTADGGDSVISLSQPSMSRAIEEVTSAIVELLASDYIRFPTTVEEKRRTMREFQEKYNMPNVLGAVDGTHIAIFKPDGNDPIAPGNLFYNRKGYYSINCQGVTNAKGKIISINPNFPGSVHDAAVWRASALSSHMETEFLQGMEDQWLLGDKGYPLLPWLMTPVSAPETEAEINYNTAHTSARNIVEMTFGRLKNKLRCLHKHRTLHYEPPKAAKIIVACCTIYNMFCDVLSDDESEDEDGEGFDNNADHQEEVGDIDGNDEEETDYLNIARAKRSSLMQLFS